MEKRVKAIGILILLSLVFFIKSANAELVADFYFEPETPLTFQNVFFWDNSTYNGENLTNCPYAVNFSWNFGDGSISYEKNTNHTYSIPGVYNVTHELTLYNESGIIDRNAVVKQIHVLNRPPAAKFYWMAEGTNFTFLGNFNYDASNDLDGYVANYTWDFGDGSTGYGAVVMHTYTISGRCNVTLTVRDNNGSANSITREINISNKMPVVNFSWEPSSPTSLDNITFTSNSYDTDGYITQWIWDFGGGNIFYNSTISYKYNDSGTYRIYLFVIDNEGAFNYTWRDVVVYNIPPFANFSWEPFYPIPNKNITFDASNSYDLDGYIANYTWDFGDGSAGYGIVVEHSYNSSGTYNVTLTVFDDDNEKANITYSILVADFYVDENVYDPDNHTWNRINDALNNASNGTYIYIREGIYEEDIEVNKEVLIEGINATIHGNVSLLKGVIFYKINSKGFSFSAKENCSVENCNLEANKINIEKGNSFSKNKIKGGIETGDKNIFRNNSIEGGIEVNGEENEFYENLIYGAFYGFNVKNGANKIISNEISGCIYGLYLREFNEIVSNNIKSNGFGIYINASNFFIGYNKLENNYYGLYVTNSINTTFFDLFLSNNTFSIYSDISYLYIENVTIDYGKNGIFINSGEIVNSSINNLENGIIGNNITIRNCSISNCKIGMESNNSQIYYSIFEENDAGVYINNTYIENCSFSKNTYGIKAGNGNRISNCSFSNNSIAIVCEGNNNSIYSSTIYKNNGGIYLKNSFNSVYENIINENEYGLRIFFSPYNNISGNNFTGNKYNFDMEGSEISHFYQTIYENNKANNLSFLYMRNASNIEINGSYGYLALVECRNISLVNFSNSHAGEVLLAGCENVMMRGGAVGENIEGIYVLKGRNLSFENLVISNNSWGLSLKSSQDLLIYNCSFEGNTKGINLFNIEREFSYVRMTLLSFYGNIYGFSIENVEGVEIQQINALMNNIDGIIYNGNVSLNNSNISFVSFKNSDLNISNSCIEKIYGEISKISILNTSVKKFDATECNLYMQKCNLSGNFSSKNGNIDINNSVFYKNGEILFNSSSVSIRNSSFESNSISKFINVTGFLENSILANNSIGILIENSKFSLINITGYKNDVGIKINSSDCRFSYGNLSENNISILADGVNNIIEKILIHHNKKGILLYGNNTLINCSFWRNEVGIEAYGSSRIYSNNFVYNSINAIERGNNSWNTSYPQGGNYWHDYSGKDIMKGEGQNISGSDGIGDAPYKINGSYDFYPLMEKCSAAFIPNEKPIAKFYFYPSLPFSFENIMFFDSSYDENGDNDIVSWLWNFGDGSTSNERNPNHNYTIPGNYTITLTVKDKSNETGIFSLNISIKNVPPCADFSFKENAKSYEVIEFNASNSYDLDGSIVNYTWSFGDGGVAYENISHHKYIKPGIYKVKLVIIDNNGSKKELEKEIEITNREPSADFIFSPEEVAPGEEVSFTDLSTDMDGEIISYIWKFGDGNVSYEKNPMHVYEKPGEYEVTLILKDDCGASSTITKTITVKKKEAPSFEFILFAIAVLLIISRKRKKN
ncbi:MAG: PKD domain-containing protein [Thermoplasmatales archaeon]|nr:PKD domain-containing protein [Thermoplasmatales archaeon]